MTNNENLMANLNDFPVPDLLDALDLMMLADRDFSPVPIEYLNMSIAEIIDMCEEKVWEDYLSENDPYRY